MVRNQDRIGQSLRFPTNGGQHFSRALNLAAWNFKQDAEIPALAKGVVTLVEFLPLGRQEMDSGQTAPLGKAGAYDVTMSRVVPVG
jgi:hypothetical protein